MKLRLIKMEKDSSIDESEWFHTAGYFIRHMRKGESLYIIICDRKSKKKDRKKSVMKRRRKILKKEIRAAARLHGVKVIFEKSCSFHELGYTYCLRERRGLRRAKRIARRLLNEGKTVLIVFPSVNRAIRPNDFHLKENKDAPLSERDMEIFQEVMEGVPYAVLIPPGTSEQEQENTLSRWGKRNPRKKQGRRPKVDNSPGFIIRRKEELLPIIQHLVQQNLRDCDICRILNTEYINLLRKYGREKMPTSTLADWTKKIKKELQANNAQLTT